MARCPWCRVALGSEQIRRAHSEVGHWVCPHCFGRMKPSLVGRIPLIVPAAVASTSITLELGLHGYAATGFGVIAAVMIADAVCRRGWIFHFRKAE
ncbi:MAG: hypothetical protein O9255_05285 [Silanimonas sp.]|nr:hypothetical protein [Silanimonas sp.]